MKSPAIVATACAAVGAFFILPAHAVVTVNIVAQAGFTVPGSGKSTVATLNAPFTDGNGKVGFTGNLNPSDNFVFYDSAIIWRNSMALPGHTLSGTEGTMGVSNTGDFIYSPSVDTNDAVWTASGVLLQASDPAPDFPNMFNTFNSRPIMVDDSSAFWMAGFGPAAATQNRVFYKSSAGVISKVFAGGDVISGFTLNTTAQNFDFMVSPNGLHHIHFVVSTDATTVNDFVMVDGAMVHREGSPTGSGANWQAFDTPSINNLGNYVFSGDDSGATPTDAFIAYNGNISIKEGDTIDGVTSASGWAVRAMSINNHNRVAFIWGTGTNEHLFEGSGPALATTTRRILSTGENVDTNGDLVADETVIDFKASGVIGPGLEFSAHRFIYVEVDLRNIATQVVRESIIRVLLPIICPADVTGDNSVGVNDLLEVINEWGPCDQPCPPHCPADATADCVVGVNDLLEVINSWGPCP